MMHGQKNIKLYCKAFVWKISIAKLSNQDWFPRCFISIEYSPYIYRVRVCQCFDAEWMHNP